MPSSSEYPKTPVTSIRASTRKSHSVWRSSSVSPGNPTITLERTPGLGRVPADPLEQAEEALRVPEAAHPAQHRGAGVLEGQVEVRRHAGRPRDRLDQAGTGLGGLQVGHPHPVDAVHRGQLGQQGLEQPEVAEVLAVGRGVLADQEQLAGALLGEPARLLQDVAGAAADEGAAEAGDRAERAAPVAAAGELEGGHRAAVEATAYAAGAGRRSAHAHVGRGRMTGDAERGGVALDRRDRQQLAPVLRGVGLVGLPRDDRAQPRRDVGVVVEAEHRVGLGQRLGEVLAVALGQAAHGHDGLGVPGLLEVGGLEQGVDRVLLGRLDEAARVDDHGLGVGGVRDEQEAAGLQPPGQLLGVDLVAGAPEGHHRHRGRDGGIERDLRMGVSGSHDPYEYDRPGHPRANRRVRAGSPGPDTPVPLSRRRSASRRGRGSPPRAGSAGRRCP